MNEEQTPQTDKPTPPRFSDAADDFEKHVNSAMSVMRSDPPEAVFEAAPSRPAVQPTQENTPAPIRVEKSKTSLGRKVLVGAGVAAATAAALTGQKLANEAADTIPKSAEINNTIVEITIAEGANVRNTPFVENGENNNVTLQPSESISVAADSDIRVYNSDDNGRWYGIPAKKLGNVSDGDGTVWVNEQGIENIEAVASN